MSDVDKQLEPYFAWHVQQWQQIIKLHDDGRLPHALLFAGPPGVGKLRFAKALAYGLLCQQRSMGVACGECKQCRLNESAHPDLKLIEPDDGARQIKVDQVREVVDFIAQTSHAGGYKISILYPAEAMNTNAANAVLKSLEEPTANSLLILVSDSPGALMPTIRSRCQQVLFPVPAQGDVLPWLISATANEQLAKELLFESEGQPLTALQYLNDGALQKHTEMQKEFLAALSGKLQPITLAERWKDHELQDILNWLQRKLSMLIKAKQAQAELPQPWLPVVDHSVTTFFALRDQVVELALKVKRGANPNRQLVVESLLLECCKQLSFR